MLGETDSDGRALRVTQFVKLGCGELMLCAVKNFDHQGVWLKETLDFLHRGHGEELGLVKNELCSVQSYWHMQIVEFALNKLTAENLFWA